MFAYLMSAADHCGGRVLLVALSESSDSILDAESDEFFDIYSDEFFDCVDPMSRAGSSRGVQARSNTM